MRYRLRVSATGEVVISQQPDISLCSLLLCREQWEDSGISAESILKELKDKAHSLSGFLGMTKYQLLNPRCQKWAGGEGTGYKKSH